MAREAILPRRCDLGATPFLVLVNRLPSGLKATFYFHELANGRRQIHWPRLSRLWFRSHRHQLHHYQKGSRASFYRPYLLAYFPDRA